MRLLTVTRAGFASAAVLLLSAFAHPASADMPANHFDNLDKRAFAMGEINGYLGLCGQADALRHRAVITKEATAADASKKQIRALRYAFDKGLSAGATAAPLQFKTCSKGLFAYLRKKNEALSKLEQQWPDSLPKK